MSDIIMGVVISDKLLTLISNTYKNKLAKSEHIIAIVNRLRKDNGMPPLPKNNFEFNTGNDKWHEETQTMGVWYSLSNPDLYKTFDNSFHEFRHSHQNFYKNDETKVSKEVSENLDGYIDDGELYYLQPCECDANEFSKALMNLIIEKCNLPFKKRNDYELEQYKKGQIENKNKFKAKGYKLTDNIFKKIYLFQNNIKKFKNTNEKAFSFRFEKFTINIVKDDMSFNYLIKNNIGIDIFQATCKNNTCFVNDIVIYKNNQQNFNELLMVNNEVIKLYNSEFNKNITGIKFNPCFTKITRSKRNSLIKNYFNLPIFLTLKDKYLEQSISLNLDKFSKIENEYYKSVKNKPLEPIINRLSKYLPIKTEEYDLIKSTMPIFSNLPNDLIHRLLTDQIRYFNTDINKVLDEKEILERLNYLKTYTGVKNPANILKMEIFLKELEDIEHTNFGSFNKPSPTADISDILKDENLTMEKIIYLHTNQKLDEYTPLINNSNISKDDEPR